MPKPKPEDIDPTKVLIGERIRRAREAQNMLPADLARGIGSSGAYVSLLEKGQSGISTARFRKVADVLKTSLEYLVTGRGSEEAIGYWRDWGEMKPDGELVDLKKIKAADAALLKGVIGKRKAEVWRLTSDSLDADYPKGTYLVVDLDPDWEPEPGDKVLVMFRDIPIFRIFVPPRLYMSTRAPQPASIPIADPNVKIVGVVLPHGLLLS